MTAISRRLIDPLRYLHTSATRKADDRAALMIRFCDVPIVVVADRGILARLATLYPDDALERDLRSCLPGYAASRFVIESQRDDSGASFYSLERDGSRMGSFKTVSSVLAHAEYQISGAAMSGLSDRPLIHAAAVARAGSAFVLPGMSLAGKSTLAAALAFSGFMYLSDEVAVVDGTSPCIYPFPKAIRLREGGWQVLTHQVDTPEPTMSLDIPTGTSMYYLTAPICAPQTAQLPVHFVVIPNREPGARGQLYSISRARALSVLASRAFQVGSGNAGNLEPLVQVVENSDCFTMTYDRLDEAVELLSSLTS